MNIVIVNAKVLFALRVLIGSFIVAFGGMLIMVPPAVGHEKAALLQTAGILLVAVLIWDAVTPIASKCFNNLRKHKS